MMRECRRLEDSYRQQIHHPQGRVLENSINGHGTVLEACLKHEPSWRWDANAHVFVNLPFRASRKMDKIAWCSDYFQGNDQWEFRLNDFQILLFMGPLLCNF